MKVLGIVGSYRKGKVIDTLVSAAVAKAEESGAETEIIYLTDSNIEFCTNCRACTQKKGKSPTPCWIKDDMNEILAKCEQADIIILGAPVNFMSLNAVTKKFMERLLPFTYWPWGRITGPRLRCYTRNRHSILISSCAMPGILGRFLTGAMFSMRVISRLLRARPYRTFVFGFSAVRQKDKASAGQIESVNKSIERLIRKLQKN